MATKQLKLTQLGLLGQFDIEPIREFRNAISLSTTRRLQSLVESQRQQVEVSPDLAQNPVLQSYFDDELVLAESIQDLADQLAIVALYGELEIRIKNMCAIAIPNVNARSLFNWKSLTTALANMGIAISGLNSYAKVNELRCLNNAIKHSRKVDVELASAGWGVEGDEIDAKRCSSAFDEFADYCEAFTSNLRGKLVALI